MKNLIFIALLTMFSVASLFAQNKGKGLKGKSQGKGQKLLQEMSTSLSLSSDQQEKIKTIFSESRAEMQKNRQKYRGNKKCLAQAKYQTRQASEFKIMNILTPEQQTKFQLEKQRRKEERARKKREELSKPIECGK